MHCNIHNTTSCLIRVHGIGQFRIFNGKIHTVAATSIASLFVCFCICDNTGIGHFRTSCCQCQNRTFSQCFLRYTFSKGEIPYIDVRICHTVCNVFGRIQYRTSTDCQYKINAFPLAECDTFPHKLQLRICCHTAKFHISNAFCFQRFFHAV